GATRAGVANGLLGLPFVDFHPRRHTPTQQPFHANIKQIPHTLAVYHTPISLSVSSFTPHHAARTLPLFYPFTLLPFYFSTLVLPNSSPPPAPRLACASPPALLSPSRASSLETPPRASTFSPFDSSTL